MVDTWINKIKPKKVYSQGSQDGIIQSIFENIGVTNKFCVEFGFNAPTLIGGSGPNTARLILEDNWNGLLLDGYYENKEINLHKEFLIPENIGDVFKKYSTPIEPDYISIDVDSIDLWLMKALLTHGYRPRVISSEYNANYPLGYSYTVKLGTNHIGDMIYGASLTALNKVAEEFNYSLIAVETHSDLFFIRNDLLGDSPPSVTEILNLSKYELVGYPCFPPTTLERMKSCLIEYPTMTPISDDIIKKFPQIFRIKTQ
jgi:hypothetical protein